MCLWKCAIHPDRDQRSLSVPRPVIVRARANTRKPCRKAPYATKVMACLCIRVFVLGLRVPAQFALCNCGCTPPMRERFPHKQN